MTSTTSEFCGTEDEIKAHEEANTETLYAIDGSAEVTMTCTY